MTTKFEIHELVRPKAGEHVCAHEYQVRSIEIRPEGPAGGILYHCRDMVSGGTAVFGEETLRKIA